jgi:hypothetical protein
MNTDTIADRFIAVDYGKPLADMIAAGKYDWVKRSVAISQADDLRLFRRCGPS